MAKKEHKELPIPDSTKRQERALEVLRVWINGDGAMDATANVAFEDPAAWGVLLIDIARHLSKAYAEQTGVDEVEAFETMRQVLHQTWDVRVQALRNKT